MQEARASAGMYWPGAHFMNDFSIMIKFDENFIQLSSKL